MGSDGDGNGREDENTGRSLLRLVRRGFDLFIYCFARVSLHLFCGFCSGAFIEK
jgi:hypothetical protein